MLSLVFCLTDINKYVPAIDVPVIAGRAAFQNNSTLN